AEPDAQVARAPAVHGARDASRHLALRRQPDGAAILARRALRDRAAQCGRPRPRSDGRGTLCDTARPRPARGELASTLQTRAGRQSAGGGAGASRARRRLWVARMLLRRLATEAGPGA